MPSRSSHIVCWALKYQLLYCIVLTEVKTDKFCSVIERSTGVRNFQEDYNNMADYVPQKAEAFIRKLE